MSRALVISFCYLLFYGALYAQAGDTLYFNKAWKPCNKSKAMYFRLVEKRDKLYLIRDFYKNGAIQMEAFATSLSPEILEGTCKYYHSNGNVESSGIYHNNKPIGVWNYYNSKGENINTYNYGISTEVKPVHQKPYTKAMSEKDKNFSVALRGKVFGFVIIEDNYFSTATLGAEVLIKGRHSLGIDYTYFGWQYEKDNTKDEPLYETYERRGYLYFDYKYRIWSYKLLDVYFNLYDKIGTYHMWQQGVGEGYNTWEKPWLNDKVDGTFNQVGAGLGIKNYFSEQFYIDVSANGGKLFSKNNSYTYDANLQTTNTLYNVKSDKTIFYMRVNFGYKLFIKKKKNEETFYTN